MIVQTHRLKNVEKSLCVGFCGSFRILLFVFPWKISKLIHVDPTRDSPSCSNWRDSLMCKTENPRLTIEHLRTRNYWLNKQNQTKNYILFGLELSKMSLQMRVKVVYARLMIQIKPRNLIQRLGIRKTWYANKKMQMYTDDFFLLKTKKFL